MCVGASAGAPLAQLLPNAGFSTPTTLTLLPQMFTGALIGTDTALPEPTPDEFDAAPSAPLSAKATPPAAPNAPVAASATSSPFFASCCMEFYARPFVCVRDVVPA
ncbi:hypothetical protein GCM10023205_35320 [Yinghuangia aomiensis]|uniref:Uncharacterized protein n=1 Tax=Yinghuangia aomiensis TaxID=676205 RepID=A0ABP9HCI8_9ACTN